MAAIVLGAAVVKVVLTSVVTGLVVGLAIWLAEPVSKFAPSVARSPKIVIATNKNSAVMTAATRLDSHGRFTPRITSATNEVDGEGNP